MCKVYCVIVMLGLYAERQGVVMASSFALHRVLVVADVFSCTDPSFADCLRLNVTVHKWTHSMVVEGVWLKQVDDIESVCSTSSSVFHSKVVPLREASR